MNLFLTHKWETEYYALAQPSMEIRFPHTGRIQISTPPFNMVFYTSKETAMEIPIKRSNVNFTLLLMPRTCFGSMLFKISFLRNICFVMETVTIDQNRNIKSSETTWIFSWFYWDWWDFRGYSLVPHIAHVII